MSEKTDLVGPVLEVPDEINPEIMLEMKLADDDPELAASAADDRYTDPMVRDLDIPTAKKLTNCTPLDRERWHAVVETLIQRGAKNAAELNKLTGINEWSARTIIKEVRERWHSTLTPGQVNSRREQLYLEAERVKEFAWTALQNLESEAMQLKYLQLILQAGQRQSSLVGAEKQQVSLEATVTARHKSGADFENEFLDNNGLSAEELKEIGNMLSRRLSGGGQNED